jgi:hypothetical protein
MDTVFLGNGQCAPCTLVSVQNAITNEMLPQVQLIIYSLRSTYSVKSIPLQVQTESTNHQSHPSGVRGPGLDSSLAFGGTGSIETLNQSILPFNNSNRCNAAVRSGVLVTTDV